MSKIKLEEDHPDTLASMHNLALTYYNHGRRKEAKQFHEQVMEMSKLKLGEDHPDTLTSMNSLAYSPRLTGEDEAARRDRKLGPDHPDTLSSKSALIEWRGDASLASP